MTITLESASDAHLAHVLAWLKEEADAGNAGFYDNRQTISNLFSRDEGICAIHTGHPVGFVVFQMYSVGSEIHIIEVHPKYRGLGIGSQLLAAARARLQALGAPYIDVACTSPSGEALCRRHGFEEVNLSEAKQDPLGPRHLRHYVQGL